MMQAMMNVVDINVIAGGASDCEHLRKQATVEIAYERSKSAKHDKYLKIYALDDTPFFLFMTTCLHQRVQIENLFINNI